MSNIFFIDLTSKLYEGLPMQKFIQKLDVLSAKAERGLPPVREREGEIH